MSLVYLSHYVVHYCSSVSKVFAWHRRHVFADFGTNCYVPVSLGVKTINQPVSYVKVLSRETRDKQQWSFNEVYFEFTVRHLPVRLRVRLHGAASRRYKTKRNFSTLRVFLYLVTSAYAKIMKRFCFIESQIDFQINTTNSIKCIILYTN